MLAPLGDRLAVDLHDVEPEVEDRGIRDGRPHPVGIDQGIEPRHLVLVDPARGDDLDVLEPTIVELPADLLEDAVKVAPPGGRGVEPDRVEVPAERLGHPDRLELLVLEGVDQRHPADLRIDHVVERAERLDGVPDHQDQRVGDRAHGVGIDQLGRLRHRHAVAAPDEGVALDHGGEPWMHPPGSEADHLALPRRLLAAGRLGRDPRGLAEEAEERGLVLRPVHVDALDGEDGLVGAEHRPFVHGGHIDRQPVQEVGGLLDSRQDPPGPVPRQALQVHLGLDARPVASGPEDLHRPVEVDVGDLARLNFLVGRQMEGTLVRHAQRSAGAPARAGDAEASSWRETQSSMSEAKRLSCSPGTLKVPGF